MDKDNKIPIFFPITVFDKLSDNGIITKARARIFYKYLNRNMSYITDDFADKLLASLPGSPVKGIYNQMVEDYTSHGKERTLGRAYGFVPETNHNISYEDHEDEDGVTRTYACADVFLWTSLYDEAKDIIGAPQSMELYEPSIVGEWEVIDGQKVYKFTEGSFLGLQALGKDVEPCFEGAAFFSLFSTMEPKLLKTLYESYLNYMKVMAQDNNGGKENMFNFKLSDNQKANKIFQALNQTEYRYWVHETYDDFAVVFDYEDETFKKVSFTKEEDKITIVGEMTQVFMEYVTAEERTALNAIQSIKGTYSAALEAFNSVTENFEVQTLKIQELDDTISTLNTEKLNINSSLVDANTKIGQLEGEVNTLSAYKVDVEKSEKKAILAQYSSQLDKSIIDDFTEDKLKQFTAIELEKELAFAMIKANPSVFSKAPQYTPKENENPSGLEALLDEYKGKKTK